MHYAVTKMLSNCKRVDCIAVAMPTFTGITIATWSDSCNFSTAEERLVVFSMFGWRHGGQAQNAVRCQEAASYPPDAWHGGVAADYAQDCFNVLLLQGIYAWRCT